MKILYIANDCHAAELAALAFRGVTPDVAISWAASLGEALSWIDDNRDVATLIVEVESDSPGCESFVRQVRGLDVAAPVIAVSVKGPFPPLTALEAAADEIVAKDGLFLNNLPDVVGRTLHTARAAARRRLRLHYLGDAALARECLGRPGASIEVVGAVPGLTWNVDSLTAEGRRERPRPFDILLIEHGYPGVDTLAILKDIAARKLHLPAVIVAEWDEELAVLALERGAADYVVKSRASFRALFFRLNRLMAHSALEGELAVETANRGALERQLAEANLALQRAEEHHASEVTAADARIAEHRTRYDARLSEAAAALLRAEQKHAATMSDAAARLTGSQQRASALLAQAGASADALESRLAETAARLERVETQAGAERQAASEEAVRREAKFEAELTREVTSRQTFAKALADAEATRQAAEQRHASGLAAAAARLTEYRKHAGGLAQTAATAEAERRRAEKQHASEMAAAAARFAEYRKQAEAQMAQGAANATAALQTAEQQASTERQAAAAQAARLQARFETELEEEVARRHAVEGELADLRAGFEQAQLRFQDLVAEIRQRASEHETRLEERAARERSEWESATEEQIGRLEDAHREERANLETGRMAIEADLARQCAGYAALQQTLDQTRATAQETLERVSRDRATERARLEALLAGRDAQLLEQKAGKQASDEAASRTLADVEHRLRLTIAAGHRDSRAIARLQEQLDALGEELEAARSQREVMKTEADRVPRLRKQIDDIRAENRRQFDHAPVYMCRCSRGGAMKQATHALADWLGYDTPEELLKADFATTVFESGGELQWMVDRCLASRSTESVETTWRKRDGSSVIVRVQAVATTPESIDLAAQDITTLRVLEERLRNSQRMEAVARYASEVAVTCDNLLGHVNQEGQQWLATIDSDTARYHGELLLDEVTRAAGFLRQLAVYGNEEKNAPELVDVNRVLRDLGPVLKRVAGGNIELVLPDASTPLNLDVEAERVERMLVNVAAYGRERMPFGGQLMIGVTSVVVDQDFVARYPNVRPGAHVLLTVNEVRGAVRPDFPATVLTGASGPNANTSPSGNPGVDLGALQTLVSDCGGHLWIMAEPPGDMVLKIHLPRRALDRLEPRVVARRPGRARWINWAPTRRPGARH